MQEHLADDVSDVPDERPVRVEERALRPIHGEARDDVISVEEVADDGVAIPGAAREERWELAGEGPTVLFSLGELGHVLLGEVLVLLGILADIAVVGLVAREERIALRIEAAEVVVERLEGDLGDVLDRGAREARVRDSRVPVRELSESGITT